MKLDALNIADLRELARRRLPKGVFEYVDRGAENEVSLDENIAALRRVKPLPKALVDVSKRDTSIELFGQALAILRLEMETTLGFIGCPSFATVDRSCIHREPR